MKFEEKSRKKDPNQVYSPRAATANAYFSLTSPFLQSFDLLKNT